MKIELDDEVAVFNIVEIMGICNSFLERWTAEDRADFSRWKINLDDYDQESQASKANHKVELLEKELAQIVDYLNKYRKTSKVIALRSLSLRQNVVVRKNASGEFVKCGDNASSANEVKLHMIYEGGNLRFCDDEGFKLWGESCSGN